MRKVEAEFTVLAHVLQPTCRKEESWLAPIVILKCHVRIAIGTNSRFKFMNYWPLFATILFFNIVASQNFTLRHCLVMRLATFNIVTLHQVACIKVRSNIHTIWEFERITAWKDVPELIILCDILARLAARAFPTLLLLASLVNLPFLVVSVDVVRLLILIVTVLRVVCVTIHLFVFPY